MKKLIDVLEKLDINKVNVNDDDVERVFSRFDINELIKFLESYGFKEVHVVDIASTEEDIEKINKAHGKCFVTNRTGFIEFADTSRNELSNDNMLYVFNKNLECFKSFTKDEMTSKKDFIEEIKQKFNF